PEAVEVGVRLFVDGGIRGDRAGCELRGGRELTPLLQQDIDGGLGRLAGRLTHAGLPPRPGRAALRLVLELVLVPVQDLLQADGGGAGDDRADQELAQLVALALRLAG